MVQYHKIHHELWMEYCFRQSSLLDSRNKRHQLGLSVDQPKESSTGTRQTETCVAPRHEDGSRVPFRPSIIFALFAERAFFFVLFFFFPPYITVLYNTVQYSTLQYEQRGRQEGALLPDRLF